MKNIVYQLFICLFSFFFLKCWNRLKFGSRKYNANKKVTMNATGNNVVEESKFTVNEVFEVVLEITGTCYGNGLQMKQEVGVERTKNKIGNKRVNNGKY